MTHRMDLRVRFCELDPYGHVNHSRYVQYFEAGRVEAMADAGVGLDRLLDELGLTMVVTEIRTKFVRSAHLGQLLTIESSLTDVGRVRASWRQRALHDGDLVAQQDMTSGCLSVEGRPTRFPAELVDALERYRVDA